jgi:hypothetical protein
MAFTVDIKGNASHLDKTLKGVKTSLGSIGSVAGSVTTALAGMGAAGAAALGAFAISSSQKASAIESLTMQFETLLGSAENAGNRIAEITKFAASTPFEISSSKRIFGGINNVIAKLNFLLFPPLRCLTFFFE